MTMRDMKQSRKFYISVEGVNCEKLYFEHLSNLINSSDTSKYKLAISPRVASPMDFAKRNVQHSKEAKKKDTKYPFIHIQDIEDYHDVTQKKKFRQLIDEIRKAEDEFKITYALGYSNYTFELWMLLHVADVDFSVGNRYSYLQLINTHFKRSYKKLDEYKSAEEFQGILDEFITLDSVFVAIDHAQVISERNKIQGKQEEYRHFKFFQDNPDTTVHSVIKIIFDACKVRRP